MNAKKRKTALTIGAIGLSAAIFTASAVAASGNLSAYNQFKESLFQTRLSPYAVQNHTSITDVNILRDGTTLMQINSVEKTESWYEKSVVETVTTQNQTASWGHWSYVEDGKVQVRVDNGQGDGVYRVYRSPYHDYMGEVEQNQIDTGAGSMDPNGAEMRFVNAVFDTLMGDCKNYFSKDGDYIAVNLSGSQIPELAQLGLAALVSQAKKEMDSPSEGSFAQRVEEKTLVSDMVKLQNIRIDHVNGRLKDVNLDMPTGSGEVTISGLDASGVRQSYVFQVNMSYTDVGTTKAERVDLEGKRQEVTEFAEEQVSHAPTVKIIAPDGSVTEVPGESQ